MDFHSVHFSMFERKKSQRSEKKKQSDPAAAERGCGSLGPSLDHTEVTFKHGSPVPHV